MPEQIVDGSHRTDRDFEASYSASELNAEELIGERTGDPWTKFTDDDRNRITIKNDDICDPAEWR